MNLDFSRFLVCIFVLAKIVFVQIIVPGGIGLGLVELEITECRTAARQSQHQQDHQTAHVGLGLFLRRFGVSFHSFRGRAVVQALFTQGAVFIDIPGLTLHGAGADFGFLRFFIQQSQQVGIIHLVQEVDRGFFVLVGTVNENVKIIPGLGGHCDKLLVAVKVIHQCCIALGRDGHTLRLHATRGGFFFDNLRQRFRGRVSTACESGHGKGAEAEQDGQQSGSETVPFIRFHWRHPPVCGTG